MRSSLSSNKDAACLYLGAFTSKASDGLFSLALSCDVIDYESNPFLVTFEVPSVSFESTATLSHSIRNYRKYSELALGPKLTQTNLSQRYIARA